MKIVGLANIDAVALIREVVEDTFKEL